MFEFVRWRQAILLLMSGWSLLILTAQIIAAILASLRARGGRLRWASVFWEWVLTAQVTILTMAGTDVLMMGSEYLWPIGHLDTPRYIVFGLVMIAALAVSWNSRSAGALQTVLVAALLLPPVEALTGSAYRICFLLALLYFQVRVIWRISTFWHDLKDSLSELSVKWAIDNMQNGLLIYDQRDIVLLVNRRMRQLTSVLYGQSLHCGDRFRGLPDNDRLPAAQMLSQFENHQVYRLPDGLIWMFSSRPVLIGRKAYTQISAADMSEQWRLTAELHTQQERLLAAQQELEAGIERLQSVRREEVLINVRSRVHDLMGQRVSLLQLLLRRQVRPEQALLENIAGNLLEQLRAPPEAADPESELARIQSIFAEIGVKVQFCGKLPDRAPGNTLAVELVRESVTNAVKHGFASEVMIRSQPSAGGYTLHIDNNGILPAEPIQEGGGLRGMREKLKPIGGQLAVTTTPRFTIRVQIPETSAGGTV